MPSVAKISTPSASRSRASPEMPSRLATDSRARTRAILHPHADHALDVPAAEYNPSRGILRPDRRPAPPHRRRPGHTDEVDRAAPPWDYLFVPFNPHTFPDLFTPTWVASLVLLVAIVVIYNARTKALHRHAPYLDLYEWILWTGQSVFGLLATAAVFSFDLIVVGWSSRSSDSVRCSGSGSSGSRRCSTPTSRSSRSSATTRRRSSIASEATIRSKAKTARRSRRRR